jgi:hypothetical protein
MARKGSNIINPNLEAYKFCHDLHDVKREAIRLPFLCRTGFLIRAKCYSSPLVKAVSVTR